MNSRSVEAPTVLAVDLDGTLLRSNMLHETFWSAFARDWRTPFLAIMYLFRGRAALKERLARDTQVDVAHLPYDPDVLEFVRDWRSRGGATALVTATNQRLANAIAAHLGGFDEVHGSDAQRNLKAREKADFLVERYGRGGFSYIGDSKADLPVWREARYALVRHNSSRLRKQASAIQGRVSFLDGPGFDPTAYIKALRPHQWLKNLLIFLAVFAAHQFDAGTFGRATLAFVSFCLVASSVYLLNDLLDLSADRVHPRKRNRPFASGRIALEHGLPLILLLLGAGAALAWSLGPRFLGVMAVYYIATTAYSLVIKRQVIIDICVLAGLYTIRVIAGGVATNIPLSVWLLAFSLFFFFSLAAMKRQIELVEAAKAGGLALSGRGYHSDDLPLVTQMATASAYVSVLVMALYVNSDTVAHLYRHPAFLWGISPVLLYWLSRAIMIAHRGEMHDDPLVFAVKDKISLLCGVLVVVFAIVGSAI